MARPCFVVLSLTTRGQGAREKSFVIPPGAAWQENLGDIESMLVSTLHFDGEATPAVSATPARENISRLDDGLWAMKLTAAPAHAAAENAKPAAKAGTTLSDDDARFVLELFFGRDSTKGLTMTNDDRETATLLLQEAVEFQCGLAVAHGMTYAVFSLRPNVMSLVVSIARRVGANCTATSEGKFYRLVIDTVRAKWGRAFTIRKDLGHW